MPLGIALVRRELQDLEEVIIGIPEVEGTNARGILDVRRKKLRPRRGILHFVLAESLIGLIHIARDDSNMLEPSVIATRIGGDRPARWRQELGQLEDLTAQSHSHDANADTEQSLEVL